MQLTEPLRWSAGVEGAEAFHSMVRRGEAVEVTHQAPRHLSGATIAVEADVYDRYICWDGDASRRHCVQLDEGHRMEAVLAASCGAASGHGGCFTCKVVDARSQEPRARTRVLTMTNYGQASRPIWLIHE